MTGSFLENQYEKTDDPFELGPLAKKIKKLTNTKKEYIKNQAKQIVKNITNPYDQMQQQSINSYATGMMNQYNSNHQYIGSLPDNQFEATNGEIAETLAELSYDDISDIVDRAYQIKSMKPKKLQSRPNTGSLGE